MRDARDAVLQRNHRRARRAAISPLWNTGVAAIKSIRRAKRRRWWLASGWRCCWASLSSWRGFGFIAVTAGVLAHRDRGGPDRRSRGRPAAHRRRIAPRPRSAAPPSRNCGALQRDEFLVHCLIYSAPPSRRRQPSIVMHLKSRPDRRLDRVAIRFQRLRGLDQDAGAVRQVRWSRLAIHFLIGDAHGDVQRRAMPTAHATPSASCSLHARTCSSKYPELGQRRHRSLGGRWPKDSRNGSPRDTTGRHLEGRQKPWPHGSRPGCSRSSFEESGAVRRPANADLRHCLPLIWQ